MSLPSSLSTYSPVIGYMYEWSKTGDRSIGSIVFDSQTVRQEGGRAVSVKAVLCIVAGNVKSNKPAVKTNIHNRGVSNTENTKLPALNLKDKERADKNNPIFIDLINRAKDERRVNQHSQKMHNGKPSEEEKKVHAQIQKQSLDSYMKSSPISNRDVQELIQETKESITSNLQAKKQYRNPKVKAVNAMEEMLKDLASLTAEQQRGLIIALIEKICLKESSSDDELTQKLANNISDSFLMVKCIAPLLEGFLKKTGFTDIQNSVLLEQTKETSNDQLRYRTIKIQRTFGMGYIIDGFSNSAIIKKGLAAMVPVELVDMEPKLLKNTPINKKKQFRSIESYWQEQLYQYALDVEDTDDPIKKAMSVKSLHLYNYFSENCELLEDKNQCDIPSYVITILAACVELYKDGKVDQVKDILEEIYNLLDDSNLENPNEKFINLKAIVDNILQEEYEATFDILRDSHIAMASRFMFDGYSNEADAAKLKTTITARELALQYQEQSIKQEQQQELVS